MNNSICKLFLVESILLGEKIATETSLIQMSQASDSNLRAFEIETKFYNSLSIYQIADGDVCRNLTIPIYVILPRLLTCPTTFSGPFSIVFKVAIVISFQSELSKLHKRTDSSLQNCKTLASNGNIAARVGSDKVRLCTRMHQAIAGRNWIILFDITF
ncbi:hypothetical protein PIB30_026143 [Stylosanthes scabra]|uniref:Uncharacterized protein n=1 Tax=Stylosanthes scabra TaxID=79078 RepID=A0ABU6U950_9FABA|nr:hypothetical protein [Stylosanthes scabra]